MNRLHWGMNGLLARYDMDIKTRKDSFSLFRHNSTKPVHNISMKTVNSKCPIPAIAGKRIAIVVYLFEHMKIAFLVLVWFRLLATALL